MLRIFHPSPQVLHPAAGGSFVMRQNPPFLFFRVLGENLGDDILKFFQAHIHSPGNGGPGNGE